MRFRSTMLPMKPSRDLLPGVRKAAASAAALFCLGASVAVADTSPMQQKIAAVEASMAKNKQMLGQYTWQQLETVSVRGDVKKTALYQVQLGADGKPVKTDISQSQPTNQRRFGIRHRIAQNYENYGKQIASLAQSYTQYQAGKLQQLFAQGKVALKSAGTPGFDSIVVSDYVKPGDSVTIVIDRATKSVVSLAINSYLDGPSDPVTISAQFAKLPDGTNHVSSVTVNGESKSLVVQQTNLDYQKHS
jgi:hypothetical protein